MNNQSLPSHTITVQPEWIDHNGHMNVAYYVLAFDLATDQFYSDLGLGLDYPDISGCAVFTTGMNVDYLREMFAGDEGIITTRLLDVDKKRIHYIHQLLTQNDHQLVATNECLAVNVDLALRKTVPFPEIIRQRLEQMLAQHQAFETPRQAGRRLEIRR